MSASAAFPLDPRSGLVELMREDEVGEIPYSHVLGVALAILTPNGHKRSVGGQTMRRQRASWTIAIPAFCAAIRLQAYCANQERLGYVIVIFCEFREPHVAGINRMQLPAIKQHSMRA